LYIIQIIDLCDIQSMALEQSQEFEEGIELLYILIYLLIKTKISIFLWKHGSRCKHTGKIYK